MGPSCFSNSIEKATLKKKILEDSIEIMQILQEKLIMPGYKHFVSNISPVMQSITLKNDNVETVLPMHLAKRIFAVNVNGHQ